MYLYRLRIADINIINLVVNYISQQLSIKCLTIVDYFNF